MATPEALKAVAPVPSMNARASQGLDFTEKQADLILGLLDQSLEIRNGLGRL